MESTDQVVAEVSRELIRSIAPGELPMFKANSAAYFANPERALKPVKGKDELLGFGVAEAAAFLTPVVLEAVRAVVAFATAELGKAARAEGGATISAWVKSLFKSFIPSAVANDAATAPALTREQLERLRSIALEKAKLYIDEAQASRLADELIGRLVTA